MGVAICILFLRKEAQSARERSPKAKTLWLSIHPLNFGSHSMVVTRPPARPSVKQGNLCEWSLSS